MVAVDGDLGGLQRRHDQLRARTGAGPARLRDRRGARGRARRLRWPSTARCSAVRPRGPSVRSRRDCSCSTTASRRPTRTRSCSRRTGTGSPSGSSSATSCRGTRPWRVRLIGPDGGIRYSENSTKARGSYQLSWPGTKVDGSARARGRWRWVVTALDEQGQSSVGRAALHAQHDARLPARLARGRELPARAAGARQGDAGDAQGRGHRHPALAPARRRPGRARAGPAGRFRAGRYVLRVAATNQLGRSELTANVR